MNMAMDFDETRCRTKADEARVLADLAKDPPVRAAFEALARSWSKMADDVKLAAAPALGRWR
jgi:hypothetical protein